MKKTMLFSGLCALALMAGTSIVHAVQPMLAAGEFHTVGLKSDGTVVAVGDNYFGQLNVGQWIDITQINTRDSRTVGLKRDGTVVALGDNWVGQLNVDQWTDITQVAAGNVHTVGLKNDGTVVGAGPNWFGQLNIGDWTDITQVAVGNLHTVGLKNDGTVVAVGGNYFGQLNVGQWTDITQVAAGNLHTVGLKNDGTVVAVGDNYGDNLNVDGWRDIIQVAAGDSSTVGLKSNGTVVAVGHNYFGQLNVSQWTDITQVAVGNLHTVGLKNDGTVVGVGENRDGNLNVSDWNLNVGQGQYGAIEGQVADASNDIEGGVVELFFVGKIASVVTDAKGYYRFDNVAEGNYRVHVIPPIQYPDLYVADIKLQQVQVRSEAISGIDFTLTKMNLDIYGDGDLDRADIQVINYLKGKAPTLCPDCDLDADGAITGLDARKAVIQCTRPGCAVE